MGKNTKIKSKIRKMCPLHILITRNAFDDYVLLLAFKNSAFVFCARVSRVRSHATFAKLCALLCIWRTLMRSPFYLTQISLWGHTLNLLLLLFLVAICRLWHSVCSAGDVQVSIATFYCIRVCKSVWKVILQQLGVFTIAAHFM